MSEQRFILIQDYDSHWFVCPDDKESEAQAYFAAVDLYWREGDYDKGVPGAPDYLKEVGGAPSMVKFTDFVIE